MADGDLRTNDEDFVDVPIGFSPDGHDITSLVFSIDLDLGFLSFDPADDNGDGVPDAVSFPQGHPSFTFVDFDAADSDGELDVALGDLDGLPLPEGLLIEIRLMPTRFGTVATWLRFSSSPAPSFGNDQGQSVPGDAVVLGVEIFADGFESGDVSAWSAVTAGPGVPVDP